MTDQKLITKDSEIMSGTPVFAGTRVPVKNLIDYLKGGHTLDEFLYDFPSVSPEQARDPLDLAGELLVSHVVPTA